VISILAAACFGRVGERHQARAALVRAGTQARGAAPQIAGVAMPGVLRDDSFAEFLLRVGVETAPPEATADWPIFRGEPARNRSAPARAPFLAPRWSRPMCLNAHTQLAVDRAWQSYREGTGTSLPLLNPLAVGDLVFTRTARGVAAFDLETGQCRWRHPADDEGENSGLDRILWQEPAGGAISLDEECVYLVDDGRLGDVDSGTPSQNTLSAREHFHSRQGNLRWLAGGADGGAEPQLAGAFFLGPPQCWQGRLYLLAERKGALSLVVLERANGRLAWLQDLALIEQGIAADTPRLLGGATPSISPDEIVVCPTSGGTVVAVDLTTQSLLWAYRYPRRIPGATGIQQFDEEFELAPRLDQFGRWLDATVAICDEKVILTPTESHEIHCLDLNAGEPRWTKPRGEGLFVACLTGNLVIIVGRRDVQALRLDDGAAAWSRPLPDGAFPAGRGVFAGDRYFLPLTLPFVLEIELAAGNVAAVHKSPRDLPAGNLIWHRGLFVSQGPTVLEAFDERDWLGTDIGERLKRNPRDPEALIRRGELELAAGRLDTALDALRAAHEVAPSPRTKSKLVSALLEGVRLRVPERDAFSAELDGLTGP
jgi:outer membrane protein assembly factor BamB